MTNSPPVSLADVRPVVQHWALLLEYTLRQNDWKPDWRTMTPAELAAKLAEEVAELNKSLVADTVFNVVREAADVAAVALMTADHAIAGRSQAYNSVAAVRLAPHWCKPATGREVACG